MTDILFLPAISRTPRPWLNGGGVTYDVVSSPAGAGPEEFDWRLSIAHVVEAGPFSLFRGIDRHLALLEGTLELRFEDRSVSPGDEPIAFSGDEAVTGRPTGGPARVLNLMVRRDRFSGCLGPAPAPDFMATAPVTILIARHAGLIEIDGAPRPMAAFDAITVPQGALVRSAAGQLLLSEIGSTVSTVIATSN